MSDEWGDFPLGEDPGLPANDNPAPDVATELNIAFGNLGKALSNYLLKVFEEMKPMMEMVADIMAESSRVRAEEQRKREVEAVLLDIDPNNQPSRPENEWTIGFDGSRSSDAVVILRPRVHLNSLDPLLTQLYHDQPITQHTNEGVPMSDEITPEAASELIEGAAEAFSSPISWVPKGLDTFAATVGPVQFHISDEDAEKALEKPGVLDNRVWVLPEAQMPKESPIHEEVLEAYDPSIAEQEADDRIEEVEGQLSVFDELAAEDTAEVLSPQQAEGFAERAPLVDPLTLDPTKPEVAEGLNRIYDAALGQSAYPEESAEQRARLTATYDAAYQMGRQSQREADEAEFEKRLADQLARFDKRVDEIRERHERGLANQRDEFEDRMKAYGERKYAEGLADNTPSTAEGKLLFDASRTINGARQDQYGKAEDSFQIIADYWSTYLESRQKEVMSPREGGVDLLLMPEDVAYMMVLFKLAREANAPKRDNRLDAAGYLALAERCLAANETEASETTSFDRYPGGDSNAG